VTRLRALLPPVLAVVLLTGCVSIPTSGGVESRPIGSDPSGDSLVDLPEGPQDGASIPDILDGFVRAGRGPQNGYRVAREYLTPDFNRDWSPTEIVRISDSVIQPLAADEDSYRLTMAVSAEVDAAGRYAERAASEEFAFEFEQIDGEWRISAAPQGTFLPSSSFDRAFRGFPLYFFAPGFEFLVPDVRWFPNTSQAPPRIVRELLAGPSPWLGSGVLVSAFPVGASLEGTFEPEGGEAVVPLSSEVGGESAAGQRRMLQQLEASLRVLGNVQRVVVTVGGLPLAISSTGTRPDQQFLVGAGPVGAVDGRFGVLALDGVRTIDDVGTRADELEASAATLGRDDAGLAVLGSGGLTLVPVAGEPILLDTRPGLLPPSVDPYGLTWSVPAADPGGLVVFGPDAAGISVPIPISGRITAFELSRDGARLLVAATTAAGPSLLLFGVVRDGDLVPDHFGAPVTLSVRSEVIDVAWVDAERIAILSRSTSDTSTTSVDVLEVGGGRTALGSVTDGRAIVGGNGGLDGVRVLDGAGVVLRPSGTTGWTDTGLRASFLATQQ
jgi:hypothetical protein